MSPAGGETLVLVNPAAHGGKGLARWRAIAPALAGRAPHRALETASAEQAREAARAAARAGAAVVAAAGGDGMVHLVLNALIDPATDRPIADAALGAVGLGSSNDFHKPRDPARDVAGVPVALDPATARPMDLGRADWLDADGRAGTAYFALNSSLGATAKGNLRYNHPTGLLALFKAISPDLAIQWGTLEAIAGFAPVAARLWLDGAEAGRHGIANLGVIKRPHFCGNMRYDTPVAVDDGFFDVNLCAEMGRLEFIRAVDAIGKGRFLGLPKTRHWRAREVRVVPEAPTALELDGEVHLIREVTLRVIPQALRICQA